MFKVDTSFVVALTSDEVQMIISALETVINEGLVDTCHDSEDLENLRNEFVNLF